MNSPGINCTFVNTSWLAFWHSSINSSTVAGIFSALIIFIAHSCPWNPNKVDFISHVNVLSYLAHAFEKASV